MSVKVEVVATSSLGDRSYLAHDGQAAVVVDPQRDIDRVMLLAGRLGVRITHVVETHLHNDYVSGGLALAKLTGAWPVTTSRSTIGPDLGVLDRDTSCRPVRLSTSTVPGSSCGG